MNNEPGTDVQRFVRIMEVIFNVEQGEITCGECFEQIDRYVDMLRAGHSPDEVLPKVKAHLGICPPCDEEFRALITFLEAQTDDPESPS